MPFCYAHSQLSTPNEPLHAPLHARAEEGDGVGYDLQALLHLSQGFTQRHLIYNIGEQRKEEPKQ